LPDDECEHTADRRQDGRREHPGRVGDRWAGALLGVRPDVWRHHERPTRPPLLESAGVPC